MKCCKLNQMKSGSLTNVLLKYIKLSYFLILFKLLVFFLNQCFFSYFYNIFYYYLFILVRNFIKLIFFYFPSLDGFVPLAPKF